jgi:hypothetical protein
VCGAELVEVSARAHDRSQALHMGDAAGRRSRDAALGLSEHPLSPLDGGKVHNAHSAGLFDS